MGDWINCREQFEAWWEENQHNGNPPRFGWDHYRDGETYSDDEFQTLWEVWQASRGTIEIEIYDFDSFSPHDCGDDAVWTTELIRTLAKYGVIVKE